MNARAIATGKGLAALAARTACFLGLLLAVGLSSGRIGGQTDALGRGLGSLALAVALVALVVETDERSAPRWRRVLVALAVAAPAALVLASVPRDARAFAIAGALAALAIVLRGERAPVRTARRAAAAVVAHGALVLALAGSAAGHHALEAWARGVGAAAALLSGVRMEVGPSAAGCWLALLALCLLVAAPHGHGAPRRAAVRLAGAALSVLAIQVAFLLAVPHALRALNRFVGHGGHGGYLPADVAALLALFLALLLAAASAPESERSAVPARSRPRLAAAAVALFALALFALPSRALAALPVRVLLHDTGYLDDRVPAVGAYGGRGAGMFGALAGALEGAGCRVERADLASVGDLSAYDVVMVVNLIQALEPHDLERLQAFVETGGGLVALGDHTGAEAIREPTNAIVSRWGIELCFDSAVAFRRSWEDALEVVPHPATRGIRRPDQVRIWTGASLDVRWPAQPLVVGQHAWCDRGDLENDERGHLGDMHWRLDERVSDVVLAAAAEPGRGRVLVLGDTSSFQNLSLPESLPFVAGALRWAAGGASGPLSRGAREAAAIAGSLGLLGGGILALAGSWPLLALLAGIGALRVVAVEGPEPDWSACLAQGERRVAAVPLAALPAQTGLVWDRAALGGLVAHLHRAGLVPVTPRAPLERWIERADVLVLPAPLVLPERSLDALERWTSRGGKVLLAVGGEHSRDVGRLLGRLGVAIGALPLGPAVTELLGGPVRFRCANPIEELPADARVLASAYGHACAAWIPEGRGGWLVVADERFLWNDNLEDEERYVPQNSAVLLRLLDMLEGHE